MQRLFKALITVAIIAVAYYIGLRCGEHNALDRQVITNNRDDSGFYTAEYKNKKYLYWYE